MTADECSKQPLFPMKPLFLVFRALRETMSSPIQKYHRNRHSSSLTPAKTTRVRVTDSSIRNSYQAQGINDALHDLDNFKGRPIWAS